MKDQLLGHYQVQEQIGSGGMGEVYRAIDLRLGRQVALKILKPTLTDDPDRLRRFEQEARSAAALNHPNIVAIYDIGTYRGTPFIVSELLQGQTLRERLAGGALATRQAADYAGQIAQGLIAAHDKRIVHRDLKPENVFITRDGRIKILDFGIAKLVHPEFEDEHSVATMTTQTRTGSVLGTVAYMSPEQLRGQAVDHRSDIFSFGAILYEMLTGRRAFAAQTQVDTMTAVLKEDPPEIARQGVAPAFEQIVRHSVEKEPENRFQSARDLAFALSTVSNAPTGRQVPASFRKKLRLSKLGLALAAGLLLAALGIFLGETLKSASNPTYQRLTFERGTVFSARFAADGRSVIYGASWSGHPLQLYSTMPDSLLGRPLGLSSAYLLAVSHTNELALSVHGTPGSRLEFVNGMLAQAPLVGGTPREILPDVLWADWSLAGSLAVVHHADARDILEYPIGKILYQTNGSISNIRFSPRSDKIAFIDHPVRFDNGGTACVIDLVGHKTTLSTGWQDAYGLAWAPRGDEIFFTAVENGSTNRSLWAVDLSGRQRKLLTVPGGFILQDVAADGRVLATLDNERLAMEWTGKADRDVQDLSWYDWSIAKDISPDGQWVLFEESSEPTGHNDAIAIRKIDGSPPIQLGEGTVDSLSSDGKWALSASPDKPAHLTLLPIGPGQSVQIPVDGFEHLQTGAHFLPDGQHIVFNGNQPGRAARSYLVSVSGGKALPITPEGMFATVPSPDGKYVAGTSAGQPITLYPLNGGPPRPVPGSSSAYLSGWSADSKGLYVYRMGEVPMKIERLDVATGKATLARELVPADRAGVVSIAPVATNLDGSEFAYSYYQTLSVLYVISGLK